MEKKQLIQAFSHHPLLLRPLIHVSEEQLFPGLTLKKISTRLNNSITMDDLNTYDRCIELASHKALLKIGEIIDKHFDEEEYAFYQRFLRASQIDKKSNNSNLSITKAFLCKEYNLCGYSGQNDTQDKPSPQRP